MKRTPAARHAGMRTEAGATSNLGEKMKKLIGVAVLVCMTSLFGMAGEVPKPEVFGGYQFTSTDGGWHANGFSTSANFYVGNRSASPATWAQDSARVRASTP